MNNAPQRRRSRIVRKRRQAFQRLLLAAGITLLLGLIPAMRALLMVHLAIDVGLAIYIVQLRRWAQADRRTRLSASSPPPPSEATIHTIDLRDVEEDPHHVELPESGLAVSR